MSFLDALEQDFETEAIAITGMACSLPQSATLEDYWNNLLSGKDCVRPVPESRWGTASSSSTLCGNLREFLMCGSGSCFTRLRV